MAEPSLARRLSRLPRATVLGRDVPIASGFRSRLLGLAFLDPDEAGAGLLIPRCSSVHTFGMRFPLDIFFLDREGTAIELRRGVVPRRVVNRRGAAAVLEIPSGPRPVTARLFGPVADLVGEDRQGADAGL
jgi:uncharacterized protein